MTTFNETERYCFELVREADRNRFLSGLFAPDDKRPHLYALYAFNAELARIRDAVREPLMGEIRLEWWQTAVERVASGQAGEHPVLVSLAPALAEKRVSVKGLAGMIEARRFDLYDDAMPSLNDLEGYLGETSSALMVMAARILASDDADRVAETAGLAGVAYGLTEILRDLPRQRARGQCFIPRDLLEQNGLEPAHMLSGRGDERLVTVLSRLAAHARQRLDEARAGADCLSRKVLPAFLHTALVEPYLDRFSSAGVDHLVNLQELSRVRRQWRIWRSARAGRF